MSRIGKNPISLPSGVEVKIDGLKVSVKGPKGQLDRTFTGPLKIREEDGKILVEREVESREARSLHGLTRSLISNMIEGVTNGYSKEMEIVGTGYRVLTRGSDIELQLGFSHPVPFKAPEGIEFKVNSALSFTISGISKELVGETAAKIRKIRPPEPYKGKGIRYKGEFVARPERRVSKCRIPLKVKANSSLANAAIFVFVNGFMVRRSALVWWLLGLTATWLLRLLMTTWGTPWFQLPPWKRSSEAKR